ncbi:hypothetical protein AGIG_G16720 [Arapaima gigas]
MIPDYRFTDTVPGNNRVSLSLHRSVTLRRDRSGGRGSDTAKGSKVSVARASGSALGWEGEGGVVVVVVAAVETIDQDIHAQEPQEERRHKATVGRVREPDPGFTPLPVRKRPAASRFPNTAQKSPLVRDSS